MNDLRKAAGEALEALEDVPYMSNKDDYERLERVKTALRQALVDDDDTSQERVDETVEQEHEPVAWIDQRIHGWPDCFVMQPDPPHTVPLYTAPQKQWVGLTEKEWYAATGIPRNAQLPMPMLKGIEKALKEKNG
jgi:hypothetical protein